MVSAPAISSLAWLELEACIRLAGRCRPHFILSDHLIDCTKIGTLSVLVAPPGFRSKHASDRWGWGKRRAWSAAESLPEFCENFKGIAVCANLYNVGSKHGGKQWLNGTALISLMELN
jgi:hypothetical protein